MEASKAQFLHFHNFRAGEGYLTYHLIITVWEICNCSWVNLIHICQQYQKEYEALNLEPAKVLNGHSCQYLPASQDNQCFSTFLRLPAISIDKDILHSCVFSIKNWNLMTWTIHGQWKTYTFTLQLKSTYCVHILILRLPYQPKTLEIQHYFTV